MNFYSRFFNSAGHGETSVPAKVAHQKGAGSPVSRRPSRLNTFSLVKWLLIAVSMSQVVLAFYSITSGWAAIDQHFDRWALRERSLTDPLAVSPRAGPPPPPPKTPLIPHKDGVYEFHPPPPRPQFSGPMKEKYTKALDFINSALWLCVLIHPFGVLAGLKESKRLVFLYEALMGVAFVLLLMRDPPEWVFTSVTPWGWSILALHLTTAILVVIFHDLLDKRAAADAAKTDTKIREYAKDVYKGPSVLPSSGSPYGMSPSVPLGYPYSPSTIDPAWLPPPPPPSFDLFHASIPRTPSRPLSRPYWPNVAPMEPRSCTEAAALFADKL